MIHLAVARTDLVDAAALGRLRSLVPPERRRKSDSYRCAEDRRASIVAFALLQSLWKNRNDGPMPEVVLGTFGKPDFDGRPDWHFNWSHESSVCICALSPMPIGVDVQARVPFEDDLFEMIAAPGERRFREWFCRRDDLSLLWTRKEAAAKRTGMGLSSPLLGIDTLTAADIASFSFDEADVRISVSAQGLSELDLLARLRILDMRPHPGVTPWSGTPHRRLLRHLQTPLI